MPDPGSKPRKRIAVAVLILGFVCLAIPWVIHRYESYLVRQRITHAYAVAQACRMVVTEFLDTHHRLPRDASEVECGRRDGAGAGVPEISMGQIKVAFREVHPEVDGRHVFLQPLDDTGVLGDGTRPIAMWRCSTDIPESQGEYGPRSDCRGAPLHH